MKWNHCKWERLRGVRVLRLCALPDGDHHKEHWPRIVILDLSAEEYLEFRENPLQFTKDYDLFPDQPILWMSGCAALPAGKGIKRPLPDSRMTVMVGHARPSSAQWMAAAQKFQGDEKPRRRRR